MSTPPVARNLNNLSLALTVVPCTTPQGYSYAVWVNPLPEGVDPATLPPPPGAVLPGQPLTPLYATIQIAAIEVQDAAGQVQVALSASFRQSSNLSSPPPSPASAGDPEAPPFGSDVKSESVQAAVTAVRAAAPGERYHRVVELLHTLRTGDVR